MPLTEGRPDVYELARVEDDGTLDNGPSRSDTTVGLVRREPAPDATFRHGTTRFDTRLIYPQRECPRSVIS